MPPGMAVLPARRPPPQCAAPRGHARRVSTSVAPRHAARCAARFRAASVSASSGGSGAGSSGGGGAELQDANWVQTALNEAVAQEDYARASQCVPGAARSGVALRASRSLTRLSPQGCATACARCWASGQGPPTGSAWACPSGWRSARSAWASAFQPRRVRSAYAATALSRDLTAPARQVQRRVLPPANATLDVVLRSSTGSGKTLAFLLPALSSAHPQKGAARCHASDAPRLSAPQTWTLCSARCRRCSSWCRRASWASST